MRPAGPFALPAVLASGALLLSLGIPAQPAAAQEATATEICVAQKLRASARLCKRVIKAAARFHRNGRDMLRDERVANAIDVFAEAWGEAEETAQGEGADCGISSHRSETVEAEADGRIAELIELVESNVRSESTRCGRDLLLAAGDVCFDLLKAERAHMKQRSQDRLRERVDGMRESSLAEFRDAWREATRNRCSDAPSPQNAQSMLESVGAGVFEKNVVSETASTDFEMIVPEGPIEYNGRTLETTCWDGQPWMMFARRGTVNKLLVYYQGGGACWDGLTCGVVRTFKQNVGEGDNPSNASSGFADMSNPENPFRDWHMVMVPYCTGDVHWGDAEEVHEFGNTATTVRHRGWINAQWAEKWAREHFVSPEMVFVTGSSAGSYGALVGSLTLQEFAYPSTDFAVLGDAGNGVITQEFLDNDLRKWGIEQNLPDWIPALNVPLGELNAADLWVESAKAYPQNRFATFTAAYDGGTGGQSGFYNVMLNPGNQLKWLNWWEASCRWNEEMLALNFDAATRAPNYRYYVASGSAHTTWGRNRVYDDTTGNVPPLVDWVDSMIADDEGWTNVLCEDCSQRVDGGDAWPNPPEPPFTADDRIVCEE